MNCEIEFMPVGDGTRGGDAIIVRYGDIQNYKLMVVDGGTVDTGIKMVAHLKRHFGDNTILSDVVLTHSDADHASGLREILREIPVTNLWLHIPWLLSAEAITLFKNKNWTAANLDMAIKKEYDILSELVDLAVANGTTIYYPFQGAQIGPFTVLSPSRNTYLHLLPQFDKTPDADQTLIEQADLWIGKAPGGVWALLEKAAAAVTSWLPEDWYTERLKDGGKTSASNESSVVLYADTTPGRILLTGDAGIRALWWATHYAKGRGFVLRDFKFVQVPHHGSRRNVGPTVLNELVGPIQQEGTEKFDVFVSAPKDDEQHPRKIVRNAFMRRGGRVIATQGSSKIWWGGFPPRQGYSAAIPLSFSSTVEAYD
jgi:hypothetical protein